MLLALLVRRLVTPQHSYGADQFVYWNARDNRRCLAPDVFVKLDVADETFDSWKAWERGVPELAIEILSPTDTSELWEWPEKIERYHELGVREVVCFDVDAPAGDRLRAWDLIEGDMVERVVEGERTPCLTLGNDVELVVAPAERWPAALRIAHAGSLVPLDSEAFARAARERDDAARERDEARARVAELERELRALKGER